MPHSTIYSTVTLYTLAALTQPTSSGTHAPLISNTHTPDQHHTHASLAPHAPIISTIRILLCANFTYLKYHDLRDWLNCHA